MSQFLIGMVLLANYDVSQTEWVNAPEFVSQFLIGKVLQLQLQVARPTLQAIVLCLNSL